MRYLLAMFNADISLALLCYSTRMFILQRDRFFQDLVHTGGLACSSTGARHQCLNGARVSTVLHFLPICTRSCGRQTCWPCVLPRCGCTCHLCVELSDTKSLLVPASGVVPTVIRNKTSAHIVSFVHWDSTRAFAFHSRRFFLHAY